MMASAGDCLESREYAYRQTSILWSDKAVSLSADGRTAENSSWVEKSLALVLLAGMLVIILRVIRDFGQQGLSISQGEAGDMQTIAEMADDADEADDNHIDWEFSCLQRVNSNVQSSFYVSSCAITGLDQQALK